MAFNVKAFEKAAFVDREATVSLPGLAGFFGDEETPEFKVRGLTATEIYQAREAGKKGKMASDLLGKLAGGSDREKVGAILEALGIDDDAPPELAQIYSHLEYGMIEPKMSRGLIIKLGRAFPIELAMLNSKILELSGQGAVAQAKQ